MVSTIQTEHDTILIAANPRAGSRSRARHLAELREWLEARSLRVETVSELDVAERRASELFEQRRLRAFVGAGGDGTLAELVNRTVPGTPLAIYPSGTANLVAKYIGVTTGCEEFGQMLLDRNTVELDAGRANGRLFLAVCSCGFDAEVVRRVHAARSGHISKYAYALPIFSAVWGYRFPELTIEVEAGTRDATSLAARWAFVSNLPCYAGGLKPGIGADGADGELDLCALDRGGLLSGLRYLPHILLGSQRRLADCTVRRAQKFRIDSAAEVPYELDGDPGGMLPVEIEVVPRRLSLIVPRGSQILSDPRCPGTLQ